LREPYFPNDAPNPLCSRTRILDFFERIFTSTISPVGRRQPWFLPGRWTLLKRHHIRIA
jgi:hypothetical protein